jgi:hypothetical protein
MTEYIFNSIYTCILRWLSRDMHLRMFGTTRDDLIGLDGMVSPSCCIDT